MLVEGTDHSGPVPLSGPRVAAAQPQAASWARLAAGPPAVTLGARGQPLEPACGLVLAAATGQRLAAELHHYTEPPIRSERDHDVSVRCDVTAHSDVIGEALTCQCGWRRTETSPAPAGTDGGSTGAGCPSKKHSPSSVRTVRAEKTGLNPSVALLPWPRGEEGRAGQGGGPPHPTARRPCARRPGRCAPRPALPPGASGGTGLMMTACSSHEPPRCTCALCFLEAGGPWALTPMGVGVGGHVRAQTAQGLDALGGPGDTGTPCLADGVSPAVPPTGHPKASRASSSSPGGRPERREDVSTLTPHAELRGVLLHKS